MKTKLGIAILTLVSSFGFAQQTPPAPPPPGVGGGLGPQKGIVMFRRELGAWWKNSKLAEKLNLTDYQIKQLEDAFYQHRLKLVDVGAETQKADMKLQQLLNADNVDEAAVNAQVDQVLAARGKMEREMTMMTLNFRKILTNEQWKQLQSIRGEKVQDHFFYRRMPAPPEGEGPGPQSELIPEGLMLPEPGTADCKTTEQNGLKIVECTKKITVTNDLEHRL